MKKEIIIDIAIIIAAMLLALFIKENIFGYSKVVGTSMMPTLENGQRLFVNKYSVKIKKKPLKREDIVIIQFKSMDKMLIKRVIGLPGETLEIRDGSLYIDGKETPEPYLDKTFNDNKHLTDKEKITEEEFNDLHNKWYGKEFKIQLEENQYFVMGDNRLNSEDSRHLGPCNYEDILGIVKY